MKYVLMLSLVVLAASCDKKPMEDPAKTVINPAATTTGQPANNGPTYQQHQAGQPQGQGIVEENDSCICTKEWKPVCGNGQTYPSACQAKCDGVSEFTEGTCQ